VAHIKVKSDDPSSSVVIFKVSYLFYVHECFLPVVKVLVLALLTQITEQVKLTSKFAKVAFWWAKEKGVGK
jgi:hypothetical protein